MALLEEGPRLVEEDLSRGMFPALAPERIPPGGAEDITNGLLDEQNVVYRRGGSSYLDPTPHGDPRLLWSGFLRAVAGEHRILATDGGTFVDGAPAGPPAPAALTRAQVFEGVLYLPGGVTWDGSSAGTIAEKRAFYAIAGGRLLAGEGSRIGFSQVPQNESDALRFETTIHSPTISTTEGSVTTTVSDATGITVGMPVLSGAGGVPDGTTVTAVSGTTITLSSPATLTAASVASAFGEANYHQLPGGVQITGMEGLRTSCVVFTTEGIWVIGNLEKELTDAEGNVQQTLDRYSADAVLWGNNGVAGWSGGLVVPCKDHIWLMQLGVSSEKAEPFVHIDDAITPVYRAYVAQGCKPGVAAVHRGHYFLPILSGSSVIDMLVCRLDATNSRGQHTYPWTHLRGSGASLAALAITDQDLAFTGAAAGLGRTLALRYFEPSGIVDQDADGTDHAFSVTYRDLMTGNLVPNLVRRARLSYRMVAPGDSALLMSFGSTRWGTRWGEFVWGKAKWAAGSGPFQQLPGEAPPDPQALNPFRWRVKRKVRYARVKVTLKGPAGSVSLRTLELFTRSSGRL